MSAPSSPQLVEEDSAPSATTTHKGVSVFPVARVQRIIKADRDVDICSKEATFLISIATEIFIRRLTDEAYTNAKLDKRKHVFYKDLSRAVQQTESLEFLRDAIPTAMPLSSALEARQTKLAQKQTEENMILEGTLQDEDDPETEQEPEPEAEPQDDRDDNQDDAEDQDGHDDDQDQMDQQDDDE
ncbi:hypothetical protein L1887_54929 [Cichorium endivia]|uniref:CCAAT-binding factor, subunit C n=1 Tax=Pseudozyma antarctica (strain T-34) TaxID=1151754 RepID=M9MA63_PSEA3|nr:hypothetical protein L1887_54929 [Cichorium endivia]GAC71333.1 CCAAT-binding factor, subunit C [Moesziomyces antarcticus T-34]